MAKKKRKIVKRTVRKKVAKVAEVVLAGEPEVIVDTAVTDIDVTSSDIPLTEEQKREAELAEKERITEEEQVKRRKEEVKEILETACNIKHLDIRWAEGFRECEVIRRRDLQVNKDHLHRTMRIPGGGPKGQGFCVLTFE